MLEHGGRLQQAAQLFGIPVDRWLDLSTGILPFSYPVPPVDAAAWHRLPEAPLALEQAAMAYYGASSLQAVAGTQAAIQALPRLRAKRHGVANVLLAAPSYQEHAYQWQRAGHRITQAGYAELERHIDQADVVVVCNPNNPTGESIAKEQLLTWEAELSARGSWLIVDEAFGDMAPQHSLAAEAARSGLIVLKSLGKFFGLAGLRVGFVCAEAALLAALNEDLGPWTVSGPSQQIAATALLDSGWQQQNRTWLAQEGQRLRALLAAHGLRSAGTDLFQWCSDAHLDGQTGAFWRFMAERAIWIRRFERAPFRPHGVRLGLPAGEAGWNQLTAALAAWSAR